MRIQRNGGQNPNRIENYVQRLQERIAKIQDRIAQGVNGKGLERKLEQAQAKLGQAQEALHNATTQDRAKKHLRMQGRWQRLLG
jgi:proline dehydrogenase